ncbi:MAG: hypothetical protein WB716_08590 [Candidatus Acidiferrales bacterium]
MMHATTISMEKLSAIPALRRFHVLIPAQFGCFYLLGNEVVSLALKVVTG